MAFLDRERAYDRVNRELVCMVLSKADMTMSDKIVKILESMHANTKAKYP